MHKFIFILLIVIATFSTPIFSQDAGSETIEQAYLRTAITIQIIENQSASEDIEQVYEALKTIENLVNNGEISDYSRDPIIDVLGQLGLRGTGSIVMEEGVYKESPADVRKKSALLLGQIGTEDSAVLLLNMLINDYEPEVLAQVAISLAYTIPTLDPNNDISPTRDEEIITYLADAMKIQNSTTGEGIFALGFLDALDYILKYDVNLLYNAELIKEITSIQDTTSGYTSLIRNKASQVLSDMQN